MSTMTALMLLNVTMLIVNSTVTSIQSIMIYKDIKK